MNIDELRAYHPNHPARPTIYEWVGQKTRLFNGPKEPDFLQSHSGMEAITMLYVEGIREYLAR